MTAMIDQEQLTLWDSVKVFIQQEDEEKAKVILKTTIEKSLRLMGVSTPIINFLNFNIPKEEYLEELKQMDAQIREELSKSSTSVTYEKVLDYLQMISGLTENPPVSYKKMVASILAKKSIKRVRIPRSRTNLSSVLAVELTGIESSDEYEDPIKELINQQFYEDKKPAKVYETYYTTSEAAKKLGVSDQTIRRMCESGKFEGAKRSGGEQGHWRIPEENFNTTREQDQKAEAILNHIDKKNNEAGDVDEFDL